MPLLFCHGIVSPAYFSLEIIWLIILYVACLRALTFLHWTRLPRLFVFENYVILNVIGNSCSNLDWTSSWIQPWFPAGFHIDFQLESSPIQVKFRWKSSCKSSWIFSIAEEWNEHVFPQIFVCSQPGRGTHVIPSCCASGPLVFFNHFHRLFLITYNFLRNQYFLSKRSLN